MGEYFVMSTRFNKCAASDFGLISKDANTAINPHDNSIWIKCVLFDFGWGKEHGFYKKPLPCFDKLIEIILYSTNAEDIYGSAAVILEKFPDQLLCKCETLMKNSFYEIEFKKMVEVFNLKASINRSFVLGKTYEQIQSDHTRWKTVAEMAMKL